MRVGVGPELRSRLDQPEPVRLDGKRLTVAEQVQHDRKRLGEHAPLLQGVDTDHHGVRRQRAGTDPEHEAAFGQMVEQNGALGDPEGRVVRQGRDASPDPDLRGPLGGRRGEHERITDELDAPGVVLADPHLVQTQAVEVLHQLEITAQGAGGIAPRLMKGGEKDSEAKSCMHRASLAAARGGRCTPDRPWRGRIGRSGPGRSA